MRRLIASGSCLLAPLVISATILAMSAPEALAEPIVRVDHVPGGGFVGDTWTFQCPPGGSAEISVDIFGDVPLETGFASALDPAIEVYDGSGKLIAEADDELQCSSPSICDAGCPGVVFQCETGLKHSVAVRDVGALVDCSGGGAYFLLIEVLDEDGTSLPGNAVKLGGGVRRNIPAFILADGFVGRKGPVIDDGPLPLPAQEPAEASSGALGKSAQRDVASKLRALSTAVK